MLTSRGVVKGNSSGIEVWRGSLIQASLRSRGGLIQEDGFFHFTSTWIRGDQQIIDATGKNLISCLVIFLLILILAFYFEHFTFLEFDLPLVTLDCKSY